MNLLIPCVITIRMHVEVAQRRHVGIAAASAAECWAVPWRCACNDGGQVARLPVAGTRIVGLLPDADAAAALKQITQLLLR